MKHTFITAMLLIFTTVVYSQSVTNIQPQVKGDKIVVTFKVSGIKYYQAVTSAKLFVSIDGGTFKGPLKKVSGNVKNLKEGQNTIVWDALKEIPFTDEDIVFDVRIVVKDKDRSRKLFFTLTGNDVTPLGLRFGQLGKTSWYAEVRASLNAMDNPDFSYTDSTISDYNKPGYYEFTGKGAWQAYSAIVGVTHQVSWNTFLYAGIGYGVENYIMEINEYDYNQPSSTGTSWAKHKEYSNSGVEIDAGVLLRFNHLVIGAGGTLLNFKSFGWSASLGYSF